MARSLADQLAEAFAERLQQPVRHAWGYGPVSVLCLVHPESRYFSIGSIGRDQVADYVRCRGMTLEEAECWRGS